ncbi:MAG: hypothetical protein KI785_00245 [Devosiaceae bacterium]|nr:hypothetical protein [Devosiaceae bacterium MH13]
MLKESIVWIDALTLEGDRLSAEGIVVRRDAIVGVRLDRPGTRLSFVAMASLLLIALGASAVAFAQTLQFFDPDYTVFAVSLLPVLGFGLACWMVRPRQHLSILLTDGSVLALQSKDAAFLDLCLEAFERLWSDPSRARSALYIHAEHRSVDFGPEVAAPLPPIPVPMPAAQPAPAGVSLPPVPPSLIDQPVDSRAVADRDDRASMLPMFDLPVFPEDEEPSQPAKAAPQEAAQEAPSEAEVKAAPDPEAEAAAAAEAQDKSLEEARRRLRTIAARQRQDRSAAPQAAVQAAADEAGEPAASDGRVKDLADSLAEMAVGASVATPPAEADEPSPEADVAAEPETADAEAGANQANELAEQLEPLVEAAPPAPAAEVEPAANDAALEVDDNFTPIPASAFDTVRGNVKTLARLLRQRSSSPALTDAVDILEKHTMEGCATERDVRALARSVSILRGRMTVYPAAIQVLDAVEIAAGFEDTSELEASNDAA